MKIRGITSVLSEEEKACIHASVVRILEEIGFKIENREVLELARKHGLPVDFEEMVVRFPREFLDDLIKRRGGHPQRSEELTCHAGGYVTYYRDIGSEDVRLHTFESAELLGYVADALPEVDFMNCLGMPCDVPKQYFGLYLKLLSFLTKKKYFSGEISRGEIDAHIKLCRRYCELTGAKFEDVCYFNVHKNKPFHQDKDLTDLMMECIHRGIPSKFTSGLAAAGSTAPVSLASLVTVNFADELGTAILNEALEGKPDDEPLRIRFAVNIMDMRTGVSKKEQPDSFLVVLMGSDMADFYGAYRYHGGCGKTQALVSDSFQCAMEKFTSMYNSFLAGTNHISGIGIIGIPDSINSIGQLILDNEVMRILRMLARGTEISEESIGVDVMKENGHTGIYMGHPHTAHYARKMSFVSEFFHGGLGMRNWRKAGGKTALDIAEEKAREMVNDVNIPDESRELKQELLALIKEETGTTIEPL